jgi:Uma2 family endonuclease
MSVQVRLHTVSELEKLLEEGERYELLQGELIGMAPTKADHGAITVEILYFLRHFVKTHRLGLVFGTEMGIKFSENDLLGVDGAYVSKERLSANAKNENGWLVFYT